MPPSSASSSAKTRPLSYAERAKKAQNIKSPIVPHSLRMTNPTPSIPAANTATTTAAAQPAAAPNDIISDSFPAPVNVEPDPPPPAPLPGPDPASSPGVKTVNGDLSLTENLASAAVSMASSQTSKPPPPPINVWNVRKMVQAQQQQQSQVKSLPSSQSASNTSPTKTAPYPVVRPVVSIHDIEPSTAPRHPPDSRLGSGGQRHGANVRSSINGINHPSQTDIDDPFVVRVYAQPIRATTSSTPHLPPLDDAETWPEVGKAAPNGSHSNPGISQPESAREKKGENEHMKESIIASRKSEKTKWVPIPAEELQAAADAIKSTMRQSHSRNHSQNNDTPLRQGGNFRNNPPSSGSGGPSRTQSGRNSLTPSQVHSRAGSAHSSPRHPNRSKRLPADDPTGSSGYSSATIEVVDRNSPLIQSDTIPVVPMSFPSSTYTPEQLSSGGGFYPNVSQAAPVQLLPQDPRQRIGQSTLLGSSMVPADYSLLGSAPPPVQPQQIYSNIIPRPYPLYPPFANYDQPQSVVFYGPRQHSPYHAPLPLYAPQPSSELQAQRQSPSEITESTGDRHKSTNAPAEVKPSEAPVESQEPQMRAVVFGSIGLPGSSKGPSPAPLAAGGETESVTDRDDGSVTAKIEKAFPSFSIGVAPGEPGPSRVKANKVRKRMETAPARVMYDAPVPAMAGVNEVKDEKEHEVPNVEKRTVGGAEMKWAFGTIRSPPAISRELDSLVPSSSSPVIVETGVDAATASTDDDLEPMVVKPPLLTVVPQGLPRPHVQTNAMVMQPVVGQLASPINGLPMAAPFPMQRTTIPILSTDSTGGSEWEVKDYGYGFGNPAYAPPLPQDEARDRERDRERAERQRVEVERERESQREGQREREFTGRPRRSSYGGYSGYDRGSFGGRRGRGVNAGFGTVGRGYNSRGSRGGYQVPQHQRQLPPFPITPPQPPFQPLSSHGDPSAYYVPRQPLTTYIPTGYDSHGHPPAIPATHATAPPIPVPLSTLSFPLDPIRTYLLGQLEYYLSPQNMAQDFFLRQRMDSRGWVPISLIASFNRVKCLTADPHLVREVLVLSSMVEVKDDWVRMVGWEQFVLPDAARSSVESPTYTSESDTNLAGEDEVDGDVDAEEDEEEEVVFVMDRQAQSWSPERRQA